MVAVRVHAHLVAHHEVGDVREHSAVRRVVPGQPNARQPVHVHHIPGVDLRLTARYYWFVQVYGIYI